MLLFSTIDNRVLVGKLNTLSIPQIQTQVQAQFHFFVVLVIENNHN